MLIVRKCWHTWIHALYTWFTLPQKNWVTPVSFNKLPLSEALIYLLKLSVSCWMLPLNSDNVTTKSVADSAVVVSWLRRAVAALGRSGSVLLVLVLAHFSLTNNPITSRACNYLPTFLFSATTSCSKLLQKATKGSPSASCPSPFHYQARHLAQWPLPRTSLPRCIFVPDIQTAPMFQCHPAAQ